MRQCDPSVAAADGGGLRAMAQIALERGVSELDSQGGRKQIRLPKRLYAEVLGISQQSLSDPPYRNWINGLEDAVRRYRNRGLEDLRLRLEGVGIVR